MPKAGSTAIQYLLSNCLPSFQKRTLSYEEVSHSVGSSAAMHAILEDGWQADQLVNTYSPMVLRSGETILVSSENYSYFSARLLQGLPFKGLGVVREPAAWIQSMATQDILFSIPRNFQNFGQLFESGLVSTEAQLLNIISTYTTKYLSMLEDIKTWANCSSQFHIIPYSAGPEFIEGVIEEINHLGIHVEPKLKVPTIRTSPNFEITQLALSIYLSSRYEFECSRTKSHRISQLAMSIDPLLYGDKLIDISSSAAELIGEQLEIAHDSYQRILRFAGHVNMDSPLHTPKFRVFDERFSRALVSSIVRTSLGLIQAPQDFNATAYLDLNPELKDQKVQSRGDSRIAIRHFESNGFKESFPVIRRDK